MTRSPAAISVPLKTTLENAWNVPSWLKWYVHQSASGDVKIGVEAGTGVWLDVNTASGSTRNELTMGADAPGATAASTGATLELRVRTASGDIDIRRVTGAFPAAV